MVVLLKQFVGRYLPIASARGVTHWLILPFGCLLFYPSVLNAFTLQQLPLHTFVNLDEKPLARVLAPIWLSVRGCALGLSSDLISLICPVATLLLFVIL